MEKLAANCYADSTWETKSAQLKKYLSFCEEFARFLKPTPCPPRQVALYITYLAKSMKYSSVRCYVSALSKFLESIDHPGVQYNHHLVAAAFKGARRRLGDNPRQAAPLLPIHLLKLGSHLRDSPGHVAFRAALLLSFRALLRKQQVTESDAMLTREDITFYKWGLMVRVRKSKTIQFKQKELLIPITKVKDDRLCAVSWVKKHIEEMKAPPSAPLFLVPGPLGPRPQTYKMYQDTLDLVCDRAGLKVADFSSHSLRRGGSTFLGMIGVSLEEIRTRGDWSSDCVMQYLKTPLDERVHQDLRVAALIEDVAFNPPKHYSDVDW